MSSKPTKKPRRANDAVEVVRKGTCKHDEHSIAQFGPSSHPPKMRHEVTARSDFAIAKRPCGSADMTCYLIFKPKKTAAPIFVSAANYSTTEKSETRGQEGSWKGFDIIPATDPVKKTNPKLIKLLKIAGIAAVICIACIELYALAANWERVCHIVHRACAELPYVRLALQFSAVTIPVLFVLYVAQEFLDGKKGRYEGAYNIVSMILFAVFMLTFLICGVAYISSAPTLGKMLHDRRVAREARIAAEAAAHSNETATATQAQ